MPPLLHRHPRAYGHAMEFRAPSLALLAALTLAGAAHAADEHQPPYWVSLRANEVNMRVGPGEDYRINWVYHRQHMPVKVLREMQDWRLVQDEDGARGWIMARFLSHERGGVVNGTSPADMHESADDGSRLEWRLAPGVVGLLGDCSDGWCKFDVDGRNGFVRQDAVWGAGAP
jgi:SH3-like domain-containing protein